MSIEAIINIVLAISTALGTFVGYYYKVKADIAKAVDAAVNNAEVSEMNGRGNEKFATAVNEVYSLVPGFLKIFIKRSYVERAINFAFEQIEAYAKKQCEKK